MTADEELEGWRAEWQSLGDESAFAQALVDRASRDGRKMRVSAAAEVLGAIASTTISAWLLISTRARLEVVVITTMVLLFNGAWLTHFFIVRAGTFRASGDGLDAFVTLTRARMTAAQRWNRYAKNWTRVLGALLVPWSIWVFWAHRDAYLAAPWRAVVGFGGWVAILGALLVYLRSREKKLRDESSSFEKQLSEATLD